MEYTHLSLRNCNINICICYTIVFICNNKLFHIVDSAPNNAAVNLVEAIRFVSQNIQMHV